MGPLLSSSSVLFAFWLWYFEAPALSGPGWKSSWEAEALLAVKVSASMVAKRRMFILLTMGDSDTQGHTLWIAAGVPRIIAL
jgi:hypothetical protein